MTEEAIEIYVSSPSCEKEGMPHGAWIDATQDVEEIQDDIEQMLRSSPLPHTKEWVISNFRGFGDIPLLDGFCTQSPLDAEESIEQISNIAQFILAQGNLARELLNDCKYLDSAKEMLEHRYHGAYESRLEFAKHLFDEVYDDAIPKNLKNYIDYEEFQHYIFRDSYLSYRVDGRSHVFDAD